MLDFGTRPIVTSSGVHENLKKLLNPFPKIGSCYQCLPSRDWEDRVTGVEKSGRNLISNLIAPEKTQEFEWNSSACEVNSASGRPYVILTRVFSIWTIRSDIRVRSRTVEARRYPIKPLKIVKFVQGACTLSGLRNITPILLTSLSGFKMDACSIHKVPLAALLSVHGHKFFYCRFMLASGNQCSGKLYLYNSSKVLIQVSSHCISRRFGTRIPWFRCQSSRFYYHCGCFSLRFRTH